jgi:hypothetical protein
VIALLEIENPSPLASVHFMPAVDEAQVNGPSVIDWPYASVGVFSPALERQLTPVHSLSVLSVMRVTDFGGEMVRQSVLVMALEPRLLSISQLMFFDGEKNSVTVEVCGTSVPDVWVVLDVVPEPPPVVVVDGAVVVDVVDDELEVGLLEQAANARAQAGRSNRLIDRFRRVVRMVQLRTAPR